MKTISAQEIQKWLPTRTNGVNVNKFSFGHVGVVAGSNNFAGAAILTAASALRTGAGLVTLFCPAEIRDAIYSRLPPEVIVCAVATNGRGFFSETNVNEIMDYSDRRKVSCFAIGPGLGQATETDSFVEKFIRTELPMVIDADALRFLSGLLADGSQGNVRGLGLLHARKAATVLTPHPGELARLLGISTEAVQDDRPAALARAIDLFRCVIVLKGFKTLIGSPCEENVVNTNGNAGMATAGTGDVLTGIIAAILAQNLGAQHAAAAGVFLHGRAGDLSASEGMTGMCASDIISRLREAIFECQAHV